MFWVVAISPTSRPVESDHLVGVIRKHPQGGRLQEADLADSAGCAMPIVSLLREAAFDPETTHILTTAFNKAWDKFKSSGSALADDACAPSTRALLAKQ